MRKPKAVDLGTLPLGSFPCADCGEQLPCACPAHGPAQRVGQILDRIEEQLGIAVVNGKGRSLEELSALEVDLSGRGEVWSLENALAVLRLIFPFAVDHRVKGFEKRLFR